MSSAAAGTICLGTPADQVFAQEGNDTLNGGAGTDTCDGRDGIPRDCAAMR